MPVLLGTRLGRYEIRSKLGAGGMGEVFLATDTKLGRDVALKVLPVEVSVDRNRMARFVQEARAVSILNHPNILTIYEIDQVDSLHFIASELIQGETLRDLLKQKQLGIAQIIDLAVQTANALVAAHDAGIVHRDLKPENIMLRSDGLAKVVDFGLAKLTEPIPYHSVDTEAPTSFKTSPGGVIGTPFYMSPEQIRERELDARTDIFSFAVVLYEMLAGRLPFNGETSAEVMASIIEEREVQPVTRYSGNVPSELERIVMKALRKNRDERYQSAKDMLLDLKTLKERLYFEQELERSVTSEKQTQATGQIFSGTITEDVRNSRKRSVALVGLALLVAASIAAAYLYKARATRATIDSIAVLPFVNASGNSELEYLSDGMTDSLINNLSLLPNLSVKARSSVFRYKGMDVEPQKLASDLSVKAILNGRVVQHGDDLTLYLSLVDGQNGNQIWGDQYDRKLSDIVRLQTDIAHEVARKLQARLSGADENRLARNNSVNAEAYQLYLKGRYHALKNNKPDLLTGISHYQRTIEIDPSYALAYVGLADAYRSPALDIEPNVVLPKAKAAANKAVELDDQSSEAHAVLGWVNFWFDWDWKAADTQLKRALELDPRNAEAHSYYANLLSNMGRHSEAVAEAKLARDLDPVNLRINAIEGQCLIFAGQVDAGLDRLQQTLALDPNYLLAHNFMISGYIAKQMFPQAEEAARKSVKIAPTNSTANSSLGYSLARAGKLTEARAVVDEMIRASSERYVSACAIALVFDGLGDQEKTFAWLERAFQEHDTRLIFLKADPKWSSLRSDPRFQEMVRRVGLPQ
jgi:eukaryotic-like serine/threonine-protein kinase